MSASVRQATTASDGSTPLTAATAWLRVGLVVGIVLIADQLSKRIVDASITPGSAHHLVAGIKLVHVRNDGVAFSVHAGGYGVILAITIVALLALVAYFALHVTRPLVWLPTGLLLGGALGNIFDRVRDGAVTDFIKLPFWPAFNLADVAITCGVVALVLVVEVSGRARGRTASDTGERAPDPPVGARATAGRSPPDPGALAGADARRSSDEA